MALPSSGVGRPLQRLRLGLGQAAFQLRLAGFRMDRPSEHGPTNG